MNLSAELSQLVDQLEPIARPGGRGRALMVMGVSRGAGASTVARELARLASQRSQRGVWLFDLDFTDNAQARAARVSGPAYDASFGRDLPWQLDGGQIILRRSSVQNLYVTEYHRNPGSALRASLRSAPDYWHAMRESIDLAIIDAPGQSRAPVELAGDMDGVILVADARHPNPEGVAARCAAIEARGGVVAGVILNRSEQARSAA
ncbi:MAG: CpsD/CapB family tyrosine-protein kinase [Alphaproteobacteria bacterium]|nr:CpsD/CapB family tyrosine-protein kinase [Alphaproteobacteria bacterium]